MTTINSYLYFSDISLDVDDRFIAPMAALARLTTAKIKTRAKPRGFFFPTATFDFGLVLVRDPEGDVTSHASETRVDEHVDHGQVRVNK